MKVALWMSVLLVMVGSSRAMSTAGLSEQMVDILKALLVKARDADSNSGSDSGSGSGSGPAVAAPVPEPVVSTLFADLGGEAPLSPFPLGVYDNAFPTEPLDATDPNYYGLFKQNAEYLVMQLERTLTMAEDTLNNVSASDASAVAAALSDDIMPKVDALGDKYNQTLLVAIRLLLKGAIAGTVENGTSEQGCFLGNVTNPVPDMVCILNKAFQVTEAMHMSVAGTYAQFYDKDTEEYGLEMCDDMMGYLNSIGWDKTLVDVSDALTNALSTISCTKRNTAKTIGTTLSGEDEDKPLLSRILRLYAMVTVVGDEATFAFTQLHCLICALQPECVVDTSMLTMSSPGITRNIGAKTTFTTRRAEQTHNTDTDELSAVDNFVRYLKHEMENEE